MNAAAENKKISLLTMQVVVEMVLYDLEDLKALAEYENKIQSETAGNADLLKISDEIISQRPKVYEALAKDSPFKKSNFAVA